MELVKTVAEMQAVADQQRAQGSILALVPTMGGLHEGHLSLVRRAKSEANHVTVSIFVNPTQFGPNEDFAAYPRDLDADCKRLKEVGGVDVVFAPDAEAFYPDGIDQQRVWVISPGMSEHLCGKYRPGHFRGVLTIVMKLFAACKPHVGIFGLKDIQQFILLGQLIKDLSLDIRLVGEPTAREPSGLAYSSRNEYLSAEERAQATVLSKAVQLAARMIKDGKKDPLKVTALVKEIIRSAPSASLQYAEVVDASTLQPIDQFTPGQKVIVAVSVFFRDVRLIDNTLVSVPSDQVLICT